MAEEAEQTLDGQLIAAAGTGDIDTLTTLLDAHPEKLHLRTPPYNGTLLHTAAFAGHLAIVELLLKRGMDVNTREGGDNTYAMHWAAAAGHVEVVRLLADAGGDVIGDGDDHAQGVIGWATGYGDGDRRRAVVDLLLSRGARHHIFSAIAMDDTAEVRRVVAADPRAIVRRQSHNEDNQLPLQCAVRMNRPAMVSLLVALGADPLGVDASGNNATAYAMTTTIDRPILD